MSIGGGTGGGVRASDEVSAAVDFTLGRGRGEGTGVRGRQVPRFAGVCVRGAGGTGSALDEAGAAVELTLGVVVVGVGVAARGGGRGHQAAAVVGAAVLEQDVGALLADRPPRVRQRRQTPRVPALHVHAVLSKERERKKERSGLY